MCRPFVFKKCFQKATNVYVQSLLYCYFFISKYAASHKKIAEINQTLAQSSILTLKDS